MKLRCRYNTNRQAYEVCDGLTVVASFSRMSEAERWQIAEECRRESEAAS